MFLPSLPERPWNPPNSLSRSYRKWNTRCRDHNTHLHLIKNLQVRGDSAFKPFGAGIIFLMLTHPVYKMWIIQELNMLEVWNKLDFEEKQTESIYHV